MALRRRGWQADPVHPFELSDGVVRLRLPDESDIPVITRICQDPEIRRWTTVPDPYLPAHAEGFVRDLVPVGWATGAALTWAVTAEHGLVGMVSLKIDDVRSAEIGYWTAPEARGEGYMSRAARLVVDAALDPEILGLDRLSWLAYLENWASRRIAWRLGFRHEGTVRGAGVQRGARQDSWVGTLLRDDPREPVEPWLGPDSASELDPDNPFARPSALPHGVVDLALVRDEDYLPAIRAGIAQCRRAVDDLLRDPRIAAAPDEGSLLHALERSRPLLDRVLPVFHHELATRGGEVLEATERECAPALATLVEETAGDPRLLERLDLLARRVAGGELRLAPDAAHRLGELRRDARLAGAHLGAAERTRLRVLGERIAAAEAEFSRVLLADTALQAVVVHDATELAGMSDADVDAAARLAADRGRPGTWLLELRLPTVQPLLGQLQDRALRERVHRASVGRGTSVSWDTRPVLLELARLRAERAELLGFAHHADLVAASGTARSGAAVRELLDGLVPGVAARLRAENAALDVLRGELGLAVDGPLEPWDRPFLAAELRRRSLGLDVAELRAYLELERVLDDGVLAAARLLYGIEVVESEGPAPVPGARALEVRESDGRPLGLVLLDVHARQGKRGGAWMSSLVDQSHLTGERPVVTVSLNVTDPGPGRPTLLDPAEVRTLFHEFGHALHGVLSDVRLPSQSGTSVPRDAVEYPSQVNEIWAWDPDLLDRYAVHHVTGEPMPASLRHGLVRSQEEADAFGTAELLAAALLDQAWHRLRPEEVPSDPADVTQFEADALERAGLGADLVVPRYRSTYFLHAFGGGYAAAYYSYLWAEVLVAESARWFDEQGGPTRSAGERFRRLVLGRGGSIDPIAAFTELVGHEPRRDAFLARLGLSGPR